MFWYLYLAHLIGDYPLQTDKMVVAKRTWWGLGLHVLVHLGVLLFIVGPYRATLWPFLLALVAVHYGIDAVKNLQSRWWPERVTGPYLFDQLLHLASIIAVAAWIESTLPIAALPSRAVWPIYAIGYLLATYVWFVTERIVARGHKDYLCEVSIQFWQRMATRAALVTIFWAGGSALVAAAPLALALQLPYLSGDYRRRALFMDIAVAFCAAILIVLAGRS